VQHNTLVKLAEMIDLGKGAGKKFVPSIHFHSIEEPALFGIR